MGLVSNTITVTPLLDVGGGNDSVLMAVYRITALRQRANVADLETARQVLRILGLREELIEDRINFALTGETLVSS